MKATFDRLSPLALALWLLAALPLAAGVWWLARHIGPPPPSRIVITSGAEGGAYHAFAQRYRQLLAQSGVTLDIRASEGSVANLARLRDPGSGVDIGLLQGGTASSKDAPELVSIGRLFYEPLWIIHRDGQGIERPTDLRGRRVAVGPEGSGTRRLVLDLLAANGIGAGAATLLPLAGDAAADAFERGEADAVLMVSAPEAPALKRLLAMPQARIMNLKTAEAHARLFPYLARLVLPHGALDLVRQIPPEDVALVAPSAVLVARESLHPAIANLLAQVASTVHAPPGLFHGAGEFPKSVDPEFPVSADALRFYRSGPPFLQRYLPFWLANLVERAALFVVPLITLAYPLARFLPWLYRWRQRERMLYWYGKLKRLEADLQDGATAEEVARLQAALDRIEREVNDSAVPRALSDQFYELRSHLNLVRQRLAAQPRADEARQA
jgi:TRAP-type uncharacterized transport system substrate-binding protein